MEFIVPQFIERETKLLGPFGFKETIFIVSAGGICIFVIYAIKNFFVSLAICFFTITISLLLIFYKKEGFSLPELIKNFTSFLTQSKIYLWKRKPITPKIEKKPSFVKKTKEEKEEELPLKIAEKSYLGKLKNFLEIKTK